MTGEDSDGTLTRFFLVGLTGGILAALVQFTVTRALDLPYPPEAIFAVLISPVPGSIQSIMVEVFREYAKYTAFASATFLYSLLYALVGVAIGHLTRSGHTGKVAVLVGASVPSAAGLLLESSLAARASALQSLAGWVTTTLVILAVNLSYSLLVISQARWWPDLLAHKALKPSAASRRQFLIRAGMVAAGLALLALAARAASSFITRQPLVRSNRPIPINSEPIKVDSEALAEIFRDPRIADLVGSEVTNNRIFYTVDINPLPPRLDFDAWSLKVGGKVRNPLTIDKARLLTLPTKDQYATLECISNTIYPPGALISNAKWTGVPLATVLREAEVSPEAKYIVFHCADGYTVGIPLARAMQPEAILAYKMNDELLPREHGFPLRALVPGIYGMMNAKWVLQIEAVDYVYFGYWQRRGWSNDARIKTTSLICYPDAGAQITDASLPIAGIAFAGDRGISKVEVSTDGGKLWTDATLKKPLSPYAWVLWTHRWKPPGKGEYVIMVRAYDAAGNVQEAKITEPFPEGASGYHSIKVSVA